LIEPCDQQKHQSYRDFNHYNLILALLLSIWLPNRVGPARHCVQDVKALDWGMFRYFNPTVSAFFISGNLIPCMTVIDALMLFSVVRWRRGAASPK
jgi:hypothetical protein